MENMTFGTRLKKLRLSKGLTQADLAELLHVSKACINRYELNKREPSFGTISIMADFFGVDFNYLLGKTSKEPAVEDINLALIQKFHALDDRGKAAVLNVLEYEYKVSKK